jgi:nucleotide-binding universal stress UspA family protein
MTDLKKPNGPILFITDLSARCDRAMDRAVSLAQAHGLGLVALHVIDTAWLQKLTQPAWRTPQQDHLALAQKRLTEDLGSPVVDLSVVVQSGNPVQVIEQVASTHGCSLIVSGTARDETLGRIVLGGTVERLARSTNTPLLVVRRRPFAHYARVLLATDFSASAHQAFKTARQFCDLERIGLYHALDSVAGLYELDQPALEEQISMQRQAMRDFYQASIGAAAPEALEITIEQGRAQTLLPVFCDKHAIDLVVLGTRGASGLVRAAMGSVAESLLNQLPCDVMLVPEA